MQKKIVLCILGAFGLMLFVFVCVTVVQIAMWNSASASHYEKTPARFIPIERLFVSNDERFYTIFRIDPRGGFVTAEIFLNGKGVNTAGDVELRVDGDQIQHSYAEIFNGWRDPIGFFKEGNTSERQKVVIHLKSAQEINAS